MSSVEQGVGPGGCSGPPGGHWGVDGYSGSLGGPWGGWWVLGDGQFRVLSYCAAGIVQSYYLDTTVLLLGQHSAATGTVQCCYFDTTVLYLGRYSATTGTLLRCDWDSTMMLLGKHSATAPAAL